MLDAVLRFLPVVPFFGVPIALVAWTIFQAAHGKLLKGLIGLAAGAALCFGAFLLFFMNIYCENCAGRPIARQEAIAVVAYFLFGVVMLAFLWWTAAPLGKPSPDRTSR